MEIPADKIKELRVKSGAGLLDCREALRECQGDLEKAYEYLRRKGLEKVKKKVDRLAKEGLIESYVHPGGRIGVLVEVNCETDFVARNQEFKEFVHNLALQIAASAPRYVSREDVPEEVKQREEAFYREEAEKAGKPAEVVEKIVKGKMEKFYEENCLLDQPYIKDTEIKVADYYGEIAGKLGENIVIRRFIRYALGEES
jgi:elongation factor Ts